MQSTFSRFKTCMHVRPGEINLTVSFFALVGESYYNITCNWMVYCNVCVLLKIKNHVFWNKFFSVVLILGVCKQTRVWELPATGCILYIVDFPWTNVTLYYLLPSAPVIFTPTVITLVEGGKRDWIWPCVILNQVVLVLCSGNLSFRAEPYLFWALHF